MPKKLTTEEFIQKAIDKHGDKYDYSKVDYINNSTKVIIICKEHGEFKQIPNSHLTGYGCNKCAQRNRCESQRFTSVNFIKKAIAIHGDKYDYSKVNYINYHTKVIIICKEHGEFEQTPGGHLNGKNGCPKCVLGIVAKLQELRKLTNEEFIQKANSKHGNKYYYSKVNYIDNRTKLIIICKEHGEFEQVPNSHLSGHGCPKCAICIRSELINLKTEGFIQKAIDIHGDKYDYSKVDYIACLREVKIICKEHGEFEQKPAGHLSGRGCPNCAQCNRCESQRFTSDDFIKKSIDKHGDKYDYSKVIYINSHTKVIIICKKHEEFKQLPYDHLNGIGCPKCGIDKLSKSLTMTTNEFIKKATAIHGNKYDYSKVKYKKTDISVKICCNKHGEFKQTPHGHLSGQGCRKCTLQTSKPAQQWIDYLSITKPEIQHFYSENGEFSIPDSKYKADGYDEETNTIYEFHGDFWHGNPKLFNQDELNKITKTTFGELFEKTISKEEFCKSKGYKYISLWENDWKKGVNAVRKIQKKFKEFYIS